MNYTNTILNTKLRSIRVVNTDNVEKGVSYEKN